MWTYEQESGNLETSDGTRVGKGYSGCGTGLNNPALEHLADVGPIPRGDYRIGRFFDDTGGKGPLVAHIWPCADTNEFGRSGFMIHGDNQACDHTASHGCIILAHSIREQIVASSDRLLKVV